MLHRGVLRAGVELGDPDQGGCEHQAHGAGTKQFHLAARSAQGVVRHQPGGDKVKGDQGQHARDGQAFVERGHHIGHPRPGLDEEAANDGGDDRHRAQGQRVQHSLTGCCGDQQCTQHHGRDQGHGIGLEQVGGHAGAIAHVVAHVVGDHGRVARIVFGDARFHFAHQVGPHVSALGENAAAQSGKNRDQRGAEGKADQGVEQGGQIFVRREVAVAHQKPVKTGHTQQTQAHHQHAGDGTSPKRHVQRRANAFGGGLGRAHVGFDRHIHADEAARARKHRADHETDGGDAIQKDGHQDGQHHADDGDGFVLPGQIGRSTILNGRCNFLHPGIAGILRKDPPSGPNAITHGNQTTHERQNER